MNPSINFFYTKKFTSTLKNQKRTRDWIKKVIAQEGRVLGGLDYIFCTDAYLLQLNKKYLKHSTFTDIISFDLSDTALIQGEIYISLDRVKDNAIRLKRPFKEEILRVMIHGVLHLLGYNDKKASDKAEMRGKEEACLSLY